MQVFTHKMQHTYTLETLHTLPLHIDRPILIFLYGDLWSGKTTLSQHIIHSLVGTSPTVTSPTYVYYNKYENIYHFDLYRVTQYDTFVSIGGEEILDNNTWVVLIEWPEVIESYYTPDMRIYIEKTQEVGVRKIHIEK